MSVHELSRPANDAVPAEALAQLRRWAEERPRQLALLHRRLGAWQAWRWRDVLGEVEWHAAGLRARGFGAGSLLALSGAFEPTLLILALAARSLGGRCVSVAPGGGEALRRQLASLRPGFAFVQGRETLSHWLQAGAEAQWPLQLFSPQALARDVGAWKVLPLAALSGDAPVAGERQAWSQVAGPELLWSDEGTEWLGGLTHLLARWLASGAGLAFPETTGSALRDRREAAPTELLLSPTRLQSLALEIEARLPPSGSWRRRLCDWTLGDPRRGVRRWIKARVRRLLGFQRLRRIEAPAAAREAGQLAWISEYLERAA